MDAFGLFTGQVGYAWNNALLYVKGGAAVTDRNYRHSLVAGGALLRSTGYQTRWGGTVGAGLEFGFAPNWSARRSNTTISSMDRHNVDLRTPVRRCVARRQHRSATPTWSPAA